MSHCTTFEMSFLDKRLLFRALRNEGLSPQNQIWKSYSSELRKRLGIRGEDLGKLLTGTNGTVQIIFMESDEGLQPTIESSVMDGEELERQGYDLLSRVQSAYLRCAVEEAVRQYRQAGLNAEIEETESDEGLSLLVRFGQSNKSITIAQRDDGTVVETVHGIEGRSCTDATSFIEGLIANQPSLIRTWQPEYSTVVEDRMIQVLKLAKF